MLSHLSTLGFNSLVSPKLPTIGIDTSTQDTRSMFKQMLLHEYVKQLSNTCSKEKTNQDKWNVKEQE